MLIVCRVSLAVTTILIYTDNQQEKCKTCEFESTGVYTMDVHVGKCKLNNFECGLCEGKFDRSCISKPVKFMNVENVG